MGLLELGMSRLSLLELLRVLLKPVQEPLLPVQEPQGLELLPPEELPLRVPVLLLVVLLLVLPLPEALLLEELPPEVEPLLSWLSCK